MSSIDTSIFRMYDIRGTYPDQMNEDLAYRIGRSYAELIKSENPEKKLKIVVARDMRNSSPSLSEAVIDGLTDGEVDVVNIGLASTPTFYFAVGYYGYDGGIQVSASHNPKEYNGCKMVRAKSVPVSGDSGVFDIRDMAEKNEFPETKEKGSVTTKDGVLADLIADQTKHADLSAIKPFKVACDAANAMGSLDIEALFEKLPCELIRVNFELDGSFPSHEADPLKEENMELLHKTVLENGADFGIGPDGDGDRIFISMENGKTLPPDILRGILAQLVLREHPGSKIGYDIRPGKATVDMIKEAGGIPAINKVGHSLIKEQMLRIDSPFSGESSGHFFYRANYGSFEMPVRTLVDFMVWLTEKDEPLSEVIKPYQRYFHSGEINSVVEDVDAVFEMLKKKYSDAKNFSDLDGVLFEYDEFWFNVRASNTEPKMRLNLEAVSQEVMEQRRDEVLAVIRGE